MHEIRFRVWPVRAGPGRRLLSWAAVASLLVAFPATVAAQGSGFGVEGRAGIGVPVGELAEFLDAGPAFGVKLLFGVSERVSLTSDGSVAALDGNPNVRTWSYLGGVRVRLTGAVASPWSVVGELGVGGVSFGKGSPMILPILPAPPPPRGTLLKASPSVRAALTLERRLGPSLAAFLNAGWQRFFTEAEDVTVEGRGTTEGFGATSLVPVTLGLRLRP